MAGRREADPQIQEISISRSRQSAVKRARTGAGVMAAQPALVPDKPNSPQVTPGECGCCPTARCWGKSTASLAVNSCAHCASSICCSAASEPSPCFRGNAERCDVGICTIEVPVRSPFPALQHCWLRTAAAAAVTAMFSSLRLPRQHRSGGPCSRFPVSLGNGLTRVQRELFVSQPGPRCPIPCSTPPG